MSYQSTASPAFLSAVERWIRETDEVLVLIRFSHAAGDRSWEFFSSLSSFQERLAGLPPRTCVIVFREHALALRGVVDEAFIARALSAFQAGAGWILVSLEPITAGRASWFHHTSINTREELEEELGSEFCVGRRVAVGREPDWLEDRDGLTAAVVPRPDGTVETGTY